MGDDNTVYLRPEAGPVPYWKHHKRAQKTIDKIIGTLNAAANSVQGSKVVVGNLTVDTNRASRIFFVSGEPGSGKSTLYQTLRVMLEEEEKGYGIGYKPSLSTLKGAVRWLDTLDLEVAGDEGENLLAAVLVRLIEVLTNPDTSSNIVLSTPCEETIKKLEELATDIGIAWEGNLRARAGELDPDTYSVEVMRTQRARLRINERLREVLDDMAEKNCYGCNKNTLFVLPVDDFYLKPEASLQLLRLLRMISIPRLFFLVMGDINTVEALFLEKSLSDWTAVAGARLFAKRSDRLDEALTRARELRARYLRKLLPPIQRTVIEAMDWHEALNFEVGRSQSKTEEVESLEKILIKVKLDPPLDGSQDEASTLHTFLISPPFSYITSNGELNKERYETEKQKRDKRAKKEEESEEESEKEIDLKKHRSAYTALQILDATPREIMDIGFALGEVIRQRKERNNKDTDKIPLLLLCIRNMVNLVREEQSFLNEKAQKILESILPTRLYSPAEINFALDRLRLRPSSLTWRDYNSKLLWIRDHRSWDITINPKFIKETKNKSSKIGENDRLEPDSDDPFAKLPPRPAAWIVLLHDLAWKWNPDSVNENLVKTLCANLKDWSWPPKKEKETDSQANKVTALEDQSEPPQDWFTRFLNQSNEFYKAVNKEEELKPNMSDDFKGWAVWYNEKEKKCEHFAMPEFETFRDLDRFLHIWSLGLEWAKKEERATGVEVSRVFLWGLAGWVMFTDAYEYFAEEKKSDDWFKDFSDTEGTFLERLKKFLDKLKDKWKIPKHSTKPIKRDAKTMSMKRLEKLNMWSEQIERESSNEGS
jgi:hypothetical protein